MAAGKTALTYRVYGLSILSELDIPGAVAVLEAESDPLRVCVCLSSPKPARSVEVIFRSPDSGTDGRPAFFQEHCRRTGDILWTWADGIIFWIESSARTIRVYWPPGETSQSAAYYLTGPVLAFLLRRKGKTLLHGSVVTSAQGAVAFLGQSGAGKSTTAAAMLQQGFAMVTDDVITLDSAAGGWSVQPGYAGVRLWQDSVEGLFGSGAVLPRLVDHSDSWPGWDKRFLEVERHGSVSTEPAMLKAIYALAPRGAGAPRIELLGSAEQLIELDINVFQPILRQAPQRQADLTLFAAMLRQVPVKRLHAGDALARLADVARLVMGDAWAP